MAKFNCCKPIFFKHEDGWDVYSKNECHKVGGRFVPKWFDAFVIEDAKTKKDAIAQLEEFHPLGICLAVA